MKGKGPPVPSATGSKSAGKGRPYRAAAVSNENGEQESKCANGAVLRQQAAKQEAINAELLRQYVTNEEETRAYWVSTTMENWYKAVEPLTFKTHFLELSNEEKLGILLRFYYPPQEPDTKPNIAEIDVLKQIALRIGLDINFNSSNDIHDKAGKYLQQLSTKIDKAINEHFPETKCVFAKLTSSSPKDSPLIIEKSIEQLEAAYGGLTKDKPGSAVPSLSELDSQSASDPHLYHTFKWIRFYKEQVRAQKIQDGDWAIRLLTTSRKVVNDLNEDLLPSCETNNQHDSLKLALREYDDRMTMAREFRMFVFDGKFTGFTQSLHIFRIPEIAMRKREIEKHFRDWFETCLKPVIESGRLPRQFAVDTLWLPPEIGGVGENAEATAEEACQRVKLIEVNPFDGTWWGVFKGSTGIFSMKEGKNYIQPDTDQLLGRVACEDPDLFFRTMSEAMSKEDIAKMIPHAVKVYADN